MFSKITLEIFTLIICLYSSEGLKCNFCALQGPDALKNPGFCGDKRSMSCSVEGHKCIQMSTVYRGDDDSKMAAYYKGCGLCDESKQYLYKPKKYDTFNCKECSKDNCNSGQFVKVPEAEVSEGKKNQQCIYCFLSEEDMEKGTKCDKEDTTKCSDPDKPSLCATASFIGYRNGEKLPSYYKGCSNGCEDIANHANITESDPFHCKVCLEKNCNKNDEFVKL